MLPSATATLRATKFARFADRRFFATRCGQTTTAPNLANPGLPPSRTKEPDALGPFVANKDTIVYPGPASLLECLDSGAAESNVKENKTD
jgi:hypothetical protein